MSSSSPGTDAQEAAKAGSQPIEDTCIEVIDLDAVRQRGVVRAVGDALERVVRPELDGFWVHLDCDALDDAVMPAVDYRLAGGLHWEELESVIRLAIASGHAVGLQITIYNPRLDHDRSIARRLVACLAGSLADTERRCSCRRKRLDDVQAGRAGLALR